MVALLAVALVAVAFAHRFPQPSGPDIGAYMLAGGAVSDICGAPGNDGQAGGPHCPACQITGTAALPGAPQDIAEADHAFVMRVVAPRESRAIRTVLDPARGKRAPPVA